MESAEFYRFTILTFTADNWESSSAKEDLIYVSNEQAVDLT